MSTLVTYFLFANLFVGFSYIILKALLRRKENLSYQQVLIVSYALLLLSLLLPLVPVERGVENPLTPVMKVMPSDMSLSDSGDVIAPVLHVANTKLNLGTAVDDVQWLVVGLLVAIGLIGLFKLLLAWRKIASIELESFQIKKIGRCEIWVSSQVKTPFSVHLGVAQVFLPLSILSDPEQMRIAIRHEIQHHRNRDTLWIHFVELFRGVFFINPFAHKFAREIDTLQEMACDEALLQSARVNPQAYGRCLLKFVEAQNQNSNLAVSCGMASEYNFLKRRLNAMFSNRKKTSNKVIGLIVTAIALGFSGTAWALKGAVKDQYFSASDIEAIAAQTKSEIPIVVDKNVVYWLNHAINNPKKRKFYKQALRRADQYKEMMSEKFVVEGLPLDFLAVPIFESGYQNLEVPTSMGSVGLWQFIPSTARRYGLTVNSEIDERMIPERHTDAAVAYYKSLYTLFEDYHAALLSYGIGETRVASLIMKAGHKDVLKAVRDSDLKPSQRSYLPKAIAALIIYKNPHLLD